MIRPTPPAPSGPTSAREPRVLFGRWLPIQVKPRGPRWTPAERRPLRRSLLVTVNYPPSLGGMESYYAALARSFPPGSIVVSTPPMAGSRVFDSDHGVPVVRPPIPRRQSHKLVFVLVWWLHTLGVVVLRDIRFLHCGNVAPVGRLCLWIRRVLGTPYAIYFHGMDVEKMSRTISRGGIRGKSLRRVFDEASILFANSADTSRRLVAAGADPSRIVLVHPGVDVDRFHPGEPRSPRAREVASPATILTVGRYAERKGVDRLIRALPRIAREIPDARLVIVGRRQEERLGALVAQLDLSRRVRFVGEVTEEELPDFYRAAAVFAMPAREDPESGSVEGFGIVFLEAAASGIPAIGGRSGGIADAIAHGETGYLVDPEDEDSLVVRTVELLRDEQLRAAMGERARRRATGEFGWKRAAATVMDAVRDAT